MTKQDILWFQIPVDDVFESKSLDCGRDLTEEHTDGVFRQRPFRLQVIRKITCVCKRVCMCMYVRVCACE